MKKLEGTPLGRIGDVDDIVSVVAFLAGNNAAWVDEQMTRSDISPKSLL